MEYKEFDLGSFINRLAQEECSENLPNWVQEALTNLDPVQFGGREWEHLQTLHQAIDKINQLIVSDFVLMQTEVYYQNILIIQNKLQALKERINSDPSNKEIKKINFNSLINPKKEEVNTKNVLDQIEQAFAGQDKTLIEDCMSFLLKGANLTTVFQQGEHSNLLGKIFELLIKKDSKFNHPEAAKICLKLIPKKDLPSILKLFFNHPELSDFSIELANGQIIHLNSIILSFRSSYFAALFNNQWKDFVKMPIQDEAVQTIFDLLSYMYTNEISISSETLDTLFSFADMWDLKEILDECNTFCVQKYGMKFVEFTKFYELQESPKPALTPEARQKLIADLSFDNYQERLAFAHDLQDKELQNSIFRWILKNLSLDNYQECFDLAENFEDKETQAAILHFLLQKFLQGNFHFSYLSTNNDEKRNEISSFLKTKGGVLKELDLRHFSSVPGRRLEALQKIALFFPNLTYLNISRMIGLSVEEINEVTKLTQVQQLYLSSTAHSSSLQCLHSLKNLTQLGFCGQVFDSPIDFSSLPLEKLDLYFCKGVKFVLPSLAHRSLKELSLSHSDFSEDCAEDLAKLTTLEILNLSNCSKAKGSFLGKITTLRNLKELNLNETIGDPEFWNDELPPYADWIKQFTRLEKLALQTASSSIKVQFYPILLSLSAIPTLKELEIKGYLLSDSCKGLLNQLKGLQKLLIHGQNVSDVLMEDISQLPQLTHLSLIWTKVSEKSYPAFSRMQKLESLFIQSGLNFLFTYQFITILTGLPNLTSISLAAGDNHGEFLGSSCGKLFSKKQNLRVLKIDNCRFITEDFISHLKNHPTLEVLHLPSVEMSTSVLQSLATLSRITHLRLPNFSNANKRNFQPILALTHLQNLTFDFSDKITYDELKLIMQLKSLRFLGVDYSQNCNKEQLEELFSTGAKEPTSMGIEWK